MILDCPFRLVKIYMLVEKLTISEIFRYVLLKKPHVWTLFSRPFGSNRFCADFLLHDAIGKIEGMKRTKKSSAAN